MRKAVLAVSFALAVVPLAAVAAGRVPVGDWGGALHHGDGAWRVRLHISAVHDGEFVGTASGFPLEPSPSPAHVALDGDRLTFSTRTGEYSGVWDQGRAAWVGTWKQADLSEPLSLRWDSDSAVRLQPGGGARIVTTPQGALVIPEGLPRSVPGELPNIIAPSR